MFVDERYFLGDTGTYNLVTFAEAVIHDSNLNQTGSLLTASVSKCIIIVLFHNDDSSSGSHYSNERAKCWRDSYLCDRSTNCGCCSLDHSISHHSILCKLPLSLFVHNIIVVFIVS